MTPGKGKTRKPAIVISRSDHERLMTLASAGPRRGAEMSDDLFDELARARIVSDERLPAEVVRMGSTLRYRTDAGSERVVTLVFPGEADIALGRVSVLTPIGAALIGLSTGQSIDWTARDGRVHRLTVESVEGPGPGPDAGSGPGLRASA